MFLGCFEMLVQIIGNTGRGDESGQKGGQKQTNIERVREKNGHQGKRSKIAEQNHKSSHQLRVSYNKKQWQIL